MKIYVCHSSAFDYKNELYNPLRKFVLNKNHKLIFPHRIDNKFVNSEDIISKCDLVISETSYPSTGMGIELGWADKENKKILFIYKKGIKISKSLQKISSDFMEYNDSEDLIKKLEKFFHDNNNK